MSRKLSRPTLETLSLVYQHVSLPTTASATATAAVAVTLQVATEWGEPKALRALRTL